MLNPGDRFGDYTVVKLLGRGGMGAVYLLENANGAQVAAKILDPASKMGEFAIAIVRRCAEKDVGLPVEKIKSSILSIPMCGVTYEFTRKVYDLLGLDSTCIAEPEKIDSYKLIEIKKDADPERILSILYKYSELQDTVGINMVCIADGKPMQLGLKAILEED